MITPSDIHYDTEFLEDGETIELISIGMATPDGRHLYLINRDANLVRVERHPWLMENVVPYLPVALTDSGLAWNKMHPDYQHVQFHYQIAEIVAEFIQATPDPRLWAWYSAYDHIALAQLWGPLVNRPKGVPMWTHELRQEAERAGNPPLPAQDEGEHHALADARHNLVIAQTIADATGMPADVFERAALAIAGTLGDAADAAPMAQQSGLETAAKIAGELAVTGPPPHTGPQAAADGSPLEDPAVDDDPADTSKDEGAAHDDDQHAA